MTQIKNRNNGCLWIIFPVVFSLIGFGVVKKLFGLSPTVAVVLSIILAIILSFLILGKPSVVGVMKTLAGIGFVVALIFVTKLFLVSIFEIPDPLGKAEEVDENVKLETQINNQDTTFLYSSNRVWKDTYGTYYNGKLSVRDSDYRRLRYRQNSFKPQANLSYWGQLYDFMEEENTPSLDLVMDTFIQIHSENKLNQMEFADMVVSCIQDIPYSFVFEEECMPASTYESSIRVVLEKCPDCCIGDISFGVQNPVSFLQNLKGDCDTRTVLIYSILKYFQYDVAILNSNHYLHSILGLNLPGAGAHKIYNGKKYVVWETTATGHRFGELPHGMKNLSHWNVVLTSK